MTKNPESRTWNPEMYNLHSWSQDCLGSLTWGEAREGGMTIALPSLTFYGPPSPKVYNVLRYTYFIYTHFDPCLVFMNCGNEMKMISFPQFIYDLFHISLTLISFMGTYEPTIDLLPSGFIAQLVEHRTGKSRGHGFKPCWSPEFFSGFFTQLHKLCSLRRSCLHFQAAMCNSFVKLLYMKIRPLVD